jgi:hypothetical protein
VALRFSDSSTSSVSYSVSGDQRDVFFLSSELDDAIARTRMWYSRIAHADVVQLLIGLLLALFVGALLLTGVLALTGQLGDKPTTARDTAIGNLLGYGLLFSVILLGSLANRIKRRLFPVGIFAWGEGSNRLQRLAFWRNVFGLGVMLAVIVEVTVGLMLR